MKYRCSAQTEVALKERLRRGSKEGFGRDRDYRKTGKVM